MYAFKLLLAMALLTAPPDGRETGDAHEVHAALRPALLELGLQWQIVDPREVRYMLARPEEFWSDLNLLRQRYAELVGAPLVEDCQRFPDRATVADLLDFNRAYRRYLDARQPLNRARWWEFQTALEETDHLYRVWDCVRDARCECYYVHVRRQALKNLREMIGEEAYYGGRLPPYVPVWHFQPID